MLLYTSLVHIYLFLSCIFKCIVHNLFTLLHIYGHDMSHLTIIKKMAAWKIDVSVCTVFTSFR